MNGFISLCKRRNVDMIDQIKQYKYIGQLAETDYYCTVNVKVIIFIIPKHDV